MEEYSAYDPSFPNEQPQSYTPYSPQSATSASSSYTVWSFQEPESLQQPQTGKGRSQSVGQASASTFFDTPATMAPMRPATSRTSRESGLVDKDGIPITYTPTTHRISKAKKGKKVHVCEYGCGKVFTRAEHRKRHEANHREDPLFKCDVEGCNKPFQRADLLARHQERQHGIPQSPSSEARRKRAASNASSAVSTGTANSPEFSSAAPAFPPSLAGSSVPSLSSPYAPATSLDPVLEPSLQAEYASSVSNWTEQLPLSRGLPLQNLAPEHIYGTLPMAEEPSPMYSPDSSYSPASEIPQQIIDAHFLSYYNKGASAYPSTLEMPAMATSGSGLEPLPLSNDYYQAPLGLGVEFTGASPSPVGNHARAAENGLVDERALTPARIDQVAPGRPTPLGPQHGPVLPPQSRTLPASSSVLRGLQPDPLLGGREGSLWSNRARDFSATPTLTSATSTRESTPSTFDAGFWNQAFSQSLPPFSFSSPAAFNASSRPNSMPPPKRRIRKAPFTDPHRAVSSSPMRGDVTDSEPARTPKRQRTNHPLTQVQTADFAPAPFMPASGDVYRATTAAIAPGGWIPTPVAGGNMQEMPRAPSQEVARRDAQKRDEPVQVLASSTRELGARGRKRARR